MLHCWASISGVRVFFTCSVKVTHSGGKRKGRAAKRLVFAIRLDNLMKGAGADAILIQADAKGRLLVAPCLLMCAGERK
jgi:hypothetical protein